MMTPQKIIEIDQETSAALWWEAGVSHQGERVGCIGQLRGGSGAAAGHLLTCALEALRVQGCGWAVGPMDGTTWHDYRVVTEDSAVPRFPGEPQTDAAWARWLSDAGFRVISHYQSLKANLLGGGGQERLGRAAERLKREGVVAREFSPAKWDEEIAGIHRVSIEAFARAFLYTPLTGQEFSALYEKMRGRIDPRWVRIAERKGETVGYVFAYQHPGILTEKALCVKTLAVIPSRSLAGLGSWLLGEVQSAAAVAGFDYALHCMENVENPVQFISERYQAVPFRRYALFGRRLTP